MGKSANKQKMSKTARTARCAKKANTSNASTADFGQVLRNEHHSIDLIEAIVADDLHAFDKSAGLLEAATGRSVFDATFRIHGRDPESGKEQLFEGDVIKLLDKSHSYEILTQVCKIGMLKNIDPILSWTAQVMIEYENASSSLDQETAEHLRCLMHCIYEPSSIASAHFLIQTVGGSPSGPKVNALVVHMCRKHLAWHEQQELEASLGAPSPIEPASKASSL